ncbi:hypothetical protein J6590_009633, partial [Homalodisca vitripennis]
TYPGRSIGRQGPILWPPRSPDLNPLGFYYWNYVNKKVFAERVRNIDKLRQCIHQAARECNASRIARKVQRSFFRSCYACIQTVGRQFEHL